MRAHATASPSNAALRFAAAVWIAAGLELAVRYSAEAWTLHGHPKRDLLGGAIVSDLLACGWGLLAAARGTAALARRASGVTVLVVVSVISALYGLTLALVGGLEDVSTLYAAVTGGLWDLSVATLKAIRAARGAVSARRSTAIDAPADVTPSRIAGRATRDPPGVWPVLGEA